MNNNNVFNWEEAQRYFGAQVRADLAKERGLAASTFAQIAAWGGIGILHAYYHRKKSSAWCICFPVYDETGAVVRAHCRWPEKNGEGKSEWFYWPFDAQQKPISPLIYGDPQKARQVFTFESPWDQIALLQVLNLFGEVDNRQVATICTRGAEGAKRLELIPWPEDVAIYAVPQNDAAGQKWLAHHRNLPRKVYILAVPADYKDFNAWLQKARPVASEIDLENAALLDNGQAPQQAEGQDASAPVAAGKVQEDFRGKSSSPLGDDKRPVIMHPVGRYISDFASELGFILKNHDFYRFHERAVWIRSLSVKDHDGREHQVKKLVELPTMLFSTIIETYCRPAIQTDNGKLSLKSISLEVAARTLCCVDFLSQLPEIKLWTDVRLPIRNATQIVLTNLGYDPDTGVYTSPDAPAIDESLSLEQAEQNWRNLLSEFCFPKSGKAIQEELDERKREPERERCIAVTLAAALTPLCILLLPQKATRPAFAVSANAEGAGKTLLLSLAMVPKLGFVPISAAPTNEEEMRKVLDAAVQHAVPILFFDNLKGHLRSGELEAFITSSTRSYRLLGSTNYTEGQNLTTVYLTANFATYSPDLRRRLLAIELILEEAKAEERVINNYLDQEKLIALRSELLSILWSFVRYWHQNGEKAPRKILPCFEAWSQCVAGIIETAGFSSHCQTAALTTGGDTDTQDMETLVSQMNPQAEFRFSELVDFARDYHLFAGLIPPEAEMDKKQSTRLGRLLRRFVNRTFAGRFKFCLKGDTRRTERYFVTDLFPGKPKANL